MELRCRESKKLASDTVLPKDIVFKKNLDLPELKNWLNSVDTDKYGDLGSWIPYTHAAAETFLENFLEERFKNFGTYEDALSQRSVRLFHSTLSPLLNTGLIEPRQIIDRAIKHADNHAIPINSLEGFVRQIIGWREFMRACI